MRLSDLISNMDLSTFPEVALVIFAGVFVAVAVRTFRSERADLDSAAALPIKEPALAGQEDSNE